MRKYDNGTNRSGMGFCDVLLIVFIILKLTDVISWGWGLVLAPLWIPILIALVVVFFTWMTN